MESNKHILTQIFTPIEKMGTVNGQENKIEEISPLTEKNTKDYEISKLNENVNINQNDELGANDKVITINKNKLLESTPTISNAVYENLPDLLKQCSDPFTDQREKDVSLISSLTILSGCFSSCEGKYDKDWSGPNLFSFIVAPPASGKGTMKYAKQLGKPINQKLISHYNSAKDEYESKMKKFKKADANNEDGAPKKPPLKVLYIPGNTSAAAIYNRLNDSNGVGIICETEADSLTGAMKQDWGNFSDMFRKAFHHEELSLARSTGDVLLNIEKPRLSALLTGTPDQVPRLIGSTEDGVCSRFLFYLFSAKPEWRNPKPCIDCTDLNSLFESLGVRVEKIKDYLDSNECKFSLKDHQFDYLSKNFEKKLNSIKIYEGFGASSAVKRLGLIAFRIAMVLTILRKLEEPAGQTNIICSDIDMNTALLLTDTFFEHALTMYSLLPNEPKVKVVPRLRSFYELLPQKEFTRAKANELGKTLNLKERTIGNNLHKLTEEGLLDSVKFGTYKKKDVS